MYRGSRLAASFLLFLTGSAATAIGLGVVAALVGPNGWPLAALAIAFGIAHFVALFGIARAREWGRTLDPDHRPEPRGGVSFAALFAIAIGANPFAGSSLPPSRRSPTAPASWPGRWRCTSCWGSAPAGSASRAGAAAAPGGRLPSSGSARERRLGGTPPTMVDAGQPRLPRQRQAGPISSARPSGAQPAEHPLQRRPTRRGRRSRRVDSRGGRRTFPLRSRRRHAVLRVPRGPVLLRGRGRSRASRDLSGADDLSRRPPPADPLPRPVLGRPDDLRQERGHPRLRMRHAPFGIGPGSATRGSATCARPSPGQTRPNRSPTRLQRTSTWPPKRCGTATEGRRP